MGIKIKIITVTAIVLYCHSVSALSDVSTSKSNKVQVNIEGTTHTRVHKSTGLLQIFLNDSVGLPIDSAGLMVVLQNTGDTTMLVTNHSGNISFTPKIFIAPDRYSYSLLLNINGTLTEIGNFDITVRKGNWVFMLIIGLLGGLSLFLFGMNMMSSGMQNSAGNKMRAVLEKLTVNRFLAVGIGALITTIIQSSSATNVMLVSFVNSRLMRFRQTIGIILGAAIGTTITAQIIAFKLTDYALLFVTIGLALNFLAKKQKLREISMAVLGFGILFYGMHIMSESMYPLRTFKPFIDIITSLENPLTGIIVGTLFTALIQSSSAFIGILIVLAMQGLLSLNASISLIIGANIGTAITAILAAIKTSREARQVAIAHTLIKVVGAGLVLLFLPFFTEYIGTMGNGIAESNITPRQIANAHTIYNVVLFLIFIPFTNSIATLVNKLYPCGETDEEILAVSYIDESLLATPDIALNAARKELLLMMDEVTSMYNDILLPFINRDTEPIPLILKKEEKVNFLRDELTDFLVQLSRSERSKNQVEEAFVLLNAVKEFEQIADIIAAQLVPKASSWCNNTFEFSETGVSELQDYHKLTYSILKKAVKLYKEFKPAKADKLEQKYSSYKEEYIELERQHYERLKENVETTVSSSKTHLIVISMFRVIGSHAADTVRTIKYSYSIRKKKK